MEKALVLNSGGVDSTTCVGIAVDQFGAENVSTVSIFYGQKHDKELRCASNIAEYYKVKHYLINLSEIMKYSNCALLSHSTDNIKLESYEEQLKKNPKVNTYVPFRNGLMLSSVAALAGSLYPNDNVHIYLGAHADDAAGNAYADCSEAFTKSMTDAIRIGTYEKVLVEAPLVKLTKAGVVEWGTKLKVPYELTWSCYMGGEKPCLECGTCRDARNAFHVNGLKYRCTGYQED